MDAEGLGRKLLMRPPLQKKTWKTSEAQTVDIVTASRKMPTKSGSKVTLGGRCPIDSKKGRK